MSASQEAGMELAIDYCIEHNILTDVLKQSREEVIGMFLSEVDIDKYERSIREEGREEAIAKFVVRLHGYGISREVAKADLMTDYALSEAAAEEKLLAAGWKDTEA